MSPLGKSVDHNKEVTELESLADYYVDEVDKAADDFPCLSRPEITEILKKVQLREEWMRTRGSALKNKSQDAQSQEG